jgi:aminoglycoside phosphotransferase (APT) family kinase protein
MTKPGVEDYRAAIVRAFPDLGNARLKLLTAGWDSVAVDVEGRLICKFPRHAQAEERLIKEAALLAVIRPRVTMTVPEMRLHAGPPLFSSHPKLHGEHLIGAQYATLNETARRLLGEDMGRFYAELHAIDRSASRAAGALPLKPWSSPDDIRAKAVPALPDELRAFANETIAAFEGLPPDPCGAVYGFFDGHGWNMAFDHARQRLNGVYDFGDSGIGPLHQEFIYSSFISPDLTDRIVSAYERQTGRALDRNRIVILTGMHRLWELSECADNPERREVALKSVAAWAAGVTPV